MTDDQDSPQSRTSTSEVRVSASGCRRVAFIAVAGWLPGLLIGVVVGTLFGIVVRDAELQEVALNPIADLELPDGTLTDEVIARQIELLAMRHLSDPQNPGVVVGILRGDERSVFGFGTCDITTNRRPDGETLFELASVGKTLTGVLLADMQRRRELNLEDPLSEHLPPGTEVPVFRQRPIRLLDLATHSSTLPSLPPNFVIGDPLNPYASYSESQMLEGLQQVRLTARPGSAYEYSNFGFGLLGHALARRAGVTYEQLVIERICNPLGMDRTRMTLDERLRSNLAVPHSDGEPVAIWEDTTMPGAGSFLSTADDMLTWLALHMRSGPSDEDPLAAAAGDAIRKRRATDLSSRSIGLGWHIDSENACDIAWHNGGAGGSCSYIALTVNPRCGVVVLANSDQPVDELGHRILYLLLRHD